MRFFPLCIQKLPASHPASVRARALIGCTLRAGHPRAVALAKRAGPSARCPNLLLNVLNCSARNRQIVLQAPKTENTEEAPAFQLQL